jgi:hypothetical protein
MQIRIRISILMPAHIPNPDRQQNDAYPHADTDPTPSFTHVGKSGENNLFLFPATPVIKVFP